MKTMLTGKVVSTAMNETVVVEVAATKVHPLYKKTIRFTKRYKAHDDLGVKDGEWVAIAQSRPFARGVHWNVVSKVEEIKKVKGKKTA